MTKIQLLLKIARDCVEVCGKGVAVDNLEHLQDHYMIAAGVDPKAEHYVVSPLDSALEKAKKDTLELLAVLLKQEGYPGPI